MVERFYESRGLPARFQLSPVSAPNDLDAVLADRGYEVDTPVEVQAAPLEEVLDRTAFASAAVDVASTPDEGWLFLWTELFRRGDPVVTRERVLDRIAPATGFALLERGDDPVAVGFGVVERGWMGIFGMATVPGARRGGAATAVLNALAGWAEGLEAKDCYLQVEAGNAPALGLYERSGFRTLYRYHYRTGHSRIRRPA